ncbi:MAG TPA: histidine kinase dimerization/phosphoacceptor domain -containing protein [Acidisoma sp.]|nr:histidine kinase dimerization/phosphoacceptor domain -containing protein [Acidisoma sp.]
MALTDHDRQMTATKPDADKVAADQVDALLNTPGLAHALDSEPFRRFLDQMPVAIAVSELADQERIIYANPSFEQLTGLATAGLMGQFWPAIDDLRPETGERETGGLGRAILGDTDFIGTFRIQQAGQADSLLDAYVSVVEDDDGKPAFRVAALVTSGAQQDEAGNSLADQLEQKDLLLREVQHRVKNNLQMITALIRIEARNARGQPEPGTFDRLAGRIEAIQLLYSLLSDQGPGEEIDLGVYLGQLAAAALKAQAGSGIRFDMKVDVFPVSVNVAMPTGLAVNEILTNALKHAFRDRDGGTITLHSLTDETGCRITVADDGVGLPPDTSWPQPGKLSYAIMQSLKDNAKAKVEVISAPDQGTRVSIFFWRANATPEAAG